MKNNILSRMFSVAIAFMVFGFMDNFIMIILGERIDLFFVHIGISNTLLAAGMGNTVSDAVGILSGRWIEKKLHRYFVLPKKGELSKGKTILSETIGIILGCLLGLLPLLFK